MKCISIRQPWAWLIVRPDIIGEDTRARAYAAGLIKDIENRDWLTRYRGPVAIHASIQFCTGTHSADSKKVGWQFS